MKPPIPIARIPFARTLAAVLCVWLLISCAQTTSVGVSNVSRSQMMIVSSESVNSEAERLYAAVLEEARSKHALNRSQRDYDRVVRIAQRLIEQAPFFREDCRNWKWEINVISSDELNAWCMPGGKIAVYSAMVSALELSDDELAVVIGHEMAHALREHSREQASQQVLQNSALSITSLFGFGGIASYLGSTVAKYGITLPFSREHETEADEIGLELVAMAGYDTDAGPRVWEKMNAADGTQPAEILSTHPSNDSRIADLTRLSWLLKQKYHSNDDSI